MPLVGLEPTRENSPDFESGASAIPPQRHKQKKFKLIIQNFQLVVNINI